ncbi:MAG: phosphatase PAP2 family protein [Alphaproteobacteria bacterium]|nr:phosphatase PAP2 family protein [Alphaproteobacteria bacterium]
MRRPPLLALACALFAATGAGAQTLDAGQWRDPILTWGSATAPVDWYAPSSGQPMFPLVAFGGASTAASSAYAQPPPAGAMPPPAAAAAPEIVAAAPGPPAQPRGEPILNSDYWLNYFWNIPRFVTAPLRFDTADWIKTGAFLVAAGGAYMADERLHKFFHDHRSTASDDLAAIGYRLGDSKTIIAGSLGGYVVGYGLATMNGGNDYRIRETSLLVLQSFALSELLAEGAKRATGRERPDTTDDHSNWRSGGKSFFSGHTVNAFSTASVISEQYDEIWVAPLAYGLAGLVAWSRLNDNAHWTSDVVVGAGVGYAVGKLVTHFSPFREQSGVSLSPLGVPGGGGVQVGFRF